MNDNDIYLIFSEQFRAIDDNLDDLMSRSENFTQASQITEAWKQANLNYLRARNKIFSNQADRIAGLVEEFKSATDAIKKSLADLKLAATTISQVAGLITAGVNTGKELQEAV